MHLGEYTVMFVIFYHRMLQLDLNRCKCMDQNSKRKQRHVTAIKMSREEETFITFPSWRDCKCHAQSLMSEYVWKETDVVTSDLVAAKTFCGLSVHGSWLS